MRVILIFPPVVMVCLALRCSGGVLGNFLRSPGKFLRVKIVASLQNHDLNFGSVNRA